ncbi:MAG: LysM peptidoglycan-binding domain-containing protein [Ilumatobacteraceae bacterium]
MPQDDDRAAWDDSFWHDSRGGAQTGPIPRIARDPRPTSRQRGVEPTMPHRVHGAARSTHLDGIAQFDDGSYSRQGWVGDDSSSQSTEPMWGPADRTSALLTIRRNRHERRPNYVMRRVAALVALGVVAAPIALLIGGGNDDGQNVAAGATPESPAADPVLTSAPVTLSVTAAPAAAAAATIATVAPVVTAAAPSASPATSPVTAAASIATPVTTSEVAATETTADPVVVKTTAATTRAPAAAIAAAVADEAPTTAATVAATVAAKLSCSKDYDVVVGDYWILIADKVSVRLDDLLEANNAKTDTPLYPGRTVCLPEGASAPTTAALTTQAPTTTDAPTTTTVKLTTTTVAAATTSSPSTTAAPPSNTYTKAEVAQIIRDVWPDELEDEAIRIATRESNLIPTVRNYCCFGLFQLYWNVHKGWMASAGITSSDQLFDPHVNAYAAYAMYLRAGGWGPWA